MRILVTGSEGQLGRSLQIAAVNSGNEYVFTDVKGLDITDAKAVDSIIKSNCFEVIINCAAFTDVERAEDQEEIAARINGEAPGNLARAARDNDITLIHISTDYVFDGKSNTPLSEDSAVAPSSAYGRTKLLGEKAIAESGCKALIIRTAWLYSEFGRNFVKTIIRLSKERESLSVVFDQIGSPTYALDLAEALVYIVDNRLYKGRVGIYHYTNEGVCSWYDFAKMAVKFAGDKACNIQPCRSTEYPSKVTRPSYSVLDKSKIKNTFNLKIPYWADSLRKCSSILLNDEK